LLGTIAMGAAFYMALVPMLKISEFHDLLKELKARLGR